MDGSLRLLSKRLTDIQRNTWIVRNPENQGEWVEIPAWSIPMKEGYVSWADANGKVYRNPVV